MRLLALLPFALVTLACSGPDKPISEPDNNEMAENLDNQDLNNMPQVSGDWSVERVEAPEECLGALPQPGDVARMTEDALRIGSFALPRTSATSFASCEADPPIDGQPTQRWVQTEVEVVETAGGVDLEFTVDRIAQGTLSDCTGFQVALREMGPCEVAGTFDATSQSIESGSCDVMWAPGTVEITQESTSIAVDWNGSEFEAELDPSTCTLTATKGISGDTSFDTWSYNGADREVSISLAFEGHLGTALIEDSIDGETLDGETCGATLEVSVERALGFDPAEPLAEATCSVERPPVCGDGVCGNFEDCRTCEADCGCGDNSCAQVEEAYLCIEPCDDVTASGQCGDGNRCGVIDGEGFIIMSGDPAYCVPSVGLAEGEACEKLSDCADGLLCHRSVQTIDSRLGVCSRPCGGGTGACDDGYVCDEAGDGGRGSYPTAAKACARVCELGQPDTCPHDSQVCADFILGGNDICVGRGSVSDAGAECETATDCAPGLRCLSSGFCTVPCDSAADCPGEAECTQSGNFGFCQRP